MLPDRVPVVTDLAGSLLPTGWPAAFARFPANGDGLHARVLDILTALGARIAAPVAAAPPPAPHPPTEPEPVTAHRAAVGHLHARVAAAAHAVVVGAGALSRP